MDVVFKASYWYADDVQNNLVVHIGGRTEDDKSVLVRVTNFKVYAYLELPLICMHKDSHKAVEWSEYLTKDLITDIINKTRQNAPVGYKCLLMSMLNEKKKVYTIRLEFKSLATMRSFEKYYLSRFIVLGNMRFPPKSFKLHEQNIDTIVKFSTVKNLDLAGWIQVNGILDPEASTVDIFLNCKESQVRRYEQLKKIYPMPNYCSFDIECFSNNPNTKLPDKNEPSNEIFQLSMVFGKLHFSEMIMHKKILLSLFNPKTITDSKLVRCESEKELILTFVKYVKKYDPDIFIGYNVVKFDWDYILARAKMLGILNQVLSMTRLKDELGIIKTSSWSSSAYGKQQFKYPELHGRVHVDVLVEVERNYKLVTYSLNFVSQQFLGETKKDVSPKQLFIFYRIARLMKIYDKKENITLADLRNIKDAVKEICPLKKAKNILRSFLKELRSATLSNIRQIMCKPMEITGEYCMHDSVLPIRLTNKLNVWSTATNMSNIMRIPISYLATRGQQIRVVAQLYEETYRDNVVVNYNPRENKKKENYQGAIVLRAIKGYYELVAVLDFTSLYPSIIISFNICHSTFRGTFDLSELEELSKSDEYYLLHWEEHVKCIHDKINKPATTEKQKKKMICCTRAFKYLKPVFTWDGNKVQISNQGLFPRLLLKLLARRKQAKNQLALTQAKLNMHKGTTTAKDIEYYTAIGAKDVLAIKKGSLTPQQVFDTEVEIKNLDSQQVSLKLSANSTYGSYGAEQAYIPHKAGAATVTAMGREFILDVVNYITQDKDVNVIYGDTDSVMVSFRGASVQQVHKNAVMLSKKVTHHLKCKILQIPENIELEVSDMGKVPIQKLNNTPLNKIVRDEHKILLYNYNYLPVNLDFEHVFGKMLLLTKKKYLAQVFNEDGVFKTAVEKGGVMQRRNNCNFLKESFKIVKTAIFAEKTYSDIIELIISRIKALFTKQIPDEDLVIYVGVADVMSYAKQRKIEKDDGSTESEYLDVVGDPFIPSGPLDNRLVYSNVPQCILLQKMMRRGEKLIANSRLEYLYLDIPGEHQGDKAEDYSYYIDNKDTLRPDYVLYLESQFEKPIYDLLCTKFPKYYVYQKIEETYKKYTLDGSIPDMKYYEKSIKRGKNYIFKTKEEAAITYLIKEKKKGLSTPFLRFLLQYKSRLVIDRIRRKHGLTKFLSETFLVKVGSKINVLHKIGLFEIGDTHIVTEIKTEGKGAHEVIYYGTDKGYIQKCYVGIEKEKDDVHNIVLCQKHYHEVVKKLKEHYQEIIKKLNKISLGKKLW